MFKKIISVVLMTALVFSMSWASLLRSSAASSVLDDFISLSGWTNDYNTAITQYNSTTAKFTCGSDTAYTPPFGQASKSFYYNVDSYPMLTINVTGISSGAQWALKVNNGGNDITIQANTNVTGILTFNLRQITNWSGNQTISIKLFPIGGNGKYLLVDYITADSYVPNVIDHFLSTSGWSNIYNSTITQNDKTNCRVTCNSADFYGGVQKSFTYDIDANPIISISVSGIGAGSSWSLKVNDGGTDIAIQSSSSSTGVFTFNLQQLTGWSGSKTFNIRLFAIGGNGCYCNVDYIAAGSVDSGLLDDLTNLTGWSNIYNSSISQNDSTTAKITCLGGDYYGAQQKSFSYNVDAFPMLTIKVSGVGSGASWALKVNNGGSDITLKNNVTISGVFTCNLKSLTGWSGTQAINLRLFAIGGNNKYFIVDYIALGTAKSSVVDDFKSLNCWSAFYNSAITQNDSTTAKITCSSSDYYGGVKQTVSYNVDTDPMITINVTDLSSNAGWALKVNDGSGDIEIQGDSSCLGVVTFDLRQITGWSGEKTFSIVIYVTGGNGKYCMVDYVGIGINRFSIDSNQTSIIDGLTSLTGWSNHYNSLISQYDSTTAKITCLGSAYYGVQQKSFTYNVSQYPILTINVNGISSGASWALKVNNGGSDICIDNGRTNTGVLTYNLQQITGWSGSQTFNIKLFPIGGNGAYFLVDYLSYGAVSLPKTSSTSSVTVFDLTQDLSLRTTDALDAYFTMVAIQGLVNRSSSNKIYFTHSPSQWAWSVAADNPRNWPADQEWLDNDLITSSYTTPTLDTTKTYPVLAYLIQNYSSYISGKVMMPSCNSGENYNGALAAAITACGSLNAVPVSPNIDSYITGLGCSLSQLADTRSLSSCVSAFNWTYDNYFNSQTNRFVIGSYSQNGYDAYYNANFPNMIDYFIANKVFVYSLDCSDDDQTALLPKLLNCNNYAYSTPVIGIFNSEGVDCSQVEDLGYCTDIWCMPDTSVTCSFPSNSNDITGQTASVPSTFDTNGAYVGFVVTDGDSGYFATGYHYYEMTQSSYKGLYPVGWETNAQLFDLFPKMLKWRSENTFSGKYETIACTWHTSKARNNGKSPFANRYEWYKDNSNGLYRSINMALMNPRNTVSEEENLCSSAGFASLIDGYGGGNGNIVTWSLFDGTNHRIYTNMSGLTQTSATVSTIVAAITNNVNNTPSGTPCFVTVCIGDGLPQSSDILYNLSQAINQINANPPGGRNFYYMQPSDVSAAWMKYTYGY